MKSSYALAFAGLAYAATSAAAPAPSSAPSPAPALTVDAAACTIKESYDDGERNLTLNFKLRAVQIDEQPDTPFAKLPAPARKYVREMGKAYLPADCLSGM